VLNIPLFKVHMPPPEALMPRLQAVLYSGQVTEGEHVVEFERRFGRYLGQDNVLSFYSGTAALHTALLLANVGPGDEVISTALTAEPTNLAIAYTGARPVWADVDPRNGNVTPESIARAMTARTKALVVVHYGGIPAPLAGIRALAVDRGLPVIEDAAHALGARYGGRSIGGHSEYVMFSLQAIKHMTTVDGGMLVCRNGDDLPRGRRLRWFGIDRRAPRTEVDVSEVGYKYHMNNVNASIGLVQLDYIAPVIERHVANGRWFDRELRDVPGLSPCAFETQAEPSYWFYTVLAENRDGLARKLSERGIGNSQAHRRNDRHTVFAASRCELPGLDAFYSRMLHIPCGWWVDDAARDYIAHAIREGW
jgi:dTDP-4-amino-4,6-dideoxygalactose transaminase